MRCEQRAIEGSLCLCECRSHNNSRLDWACLRRRRRCHSHSRVQKKAAARVDRAICNTIMYSRGWSLVFVCLDRSASLIHTDHNKNKTFNLPD